MRKSRVTTKGTVPYCLLDQDTMASIESSSDYFSRTYIEFHEVSKSFDRPVLVNCNFSIKASEALAIVGPRGSGKSLILRLLMGFEQPDRGKLVVAFEEMQSATEDDWSRIRDKISMISQSGMVFETLTVNDNVRYYLVERGDLDEVQIGQIADGLLDMGGMKHFKHLMPADLPVAERRMLAFLHVLGGQRECVLFDEPTAGLDPAKAQLLVELMRKLKSQLRLGMVLTTSDLDLVRVVCDRVLFLDQGNVIYFGTAKEFFEQDDHRIQHYLRMEATS